MANILAPFGFRHIGYVEGYPPSMGLRHRKIRAANTNPIFRGDPVVTGTSTDQGYIVQASTNTSADTATSPAPTVGGIFHGCEYISTSQGRKVRSNYWPGSDATGDVDAFIIDTAGALFLVQSNGSPVVLANIGNNVGMFIATGTTSTAGDGKGNPTTQLSGAMLDIAGTNGSGSGAIGTGAALPFKIYDLFSQYAAQGNPSPALGTTAIQGADNSSNFNWAIVTMNLSEARRGTLGI